MRLRHAALAAFCLIGTPYVAAQTGPDSSATRAHRALVIALKDELRRLVKAQDAYLAQHDTYTAVLPSSAFLVAPDREVTIMPAGPRGYSVTMSSALEPGLTCGLYVGAGTAPNAAVFKARDPACWRPLPGGSLSAE